MVETRHPRREHSALVAKDPDARVVERTRRPDSGRKMRCAPRLALDHMCIDRDNWVHLGRPDVDLAVLQDLP